jgi:hypothetical protein
VGVGLQERANLTKIQRPPPTATLALVIARRTTPTTPTAPLVEPPRSHTCDDSVDLLVELDALDHGVLIDTEQPTPYFDAQHPVSLPAVPGP